MAQACCWTHSPALHCQRRRHTGEKNTYLSTLISACRNATYKLSIMGVEVHGLCVSLCRGMDFIRWYMGGHAIRACRVWVFRVREENSSEEDMTSCCNVSNLIPMDEEVLMWSNSLVLICSSQNRLFRFLGVFSPQSIKFFRLSI